MSGKDVGMTSPVISSRFIWCIRLLASAFALWAIYRHLLRPDWSVRLTVGSEVFDTYQRFWLWESPEASEHGGVLGGIRWGRSLFLLAGNLLMAVGAWRLPVSVGSVPWHPNKPKQPTGAPSGVGT
jgi:hypothetical protein